MASSPYNLQSLEQAMAQEEGFNVSGSLPQTLNNPLDIMQGGQLAAYSSPLSGWEAGLQKLQYDLSGNSSVYSPNQTLSQFESTWTGGDPNAGNNVASILGVSPSTPMSAFTGSQSSSAPKTFSWTDPSTWFIDQNPGQPLVSFPSFEKGLSSAVKSGVSVLGMPLMSIVAILAGLILIAGAVFGFRNMTTAVVEGVKTGAAAA